MNKRIISKRSVLIAAIIAGLSITAFFLWQHYKYRLAEYQLSDVLKYQTDSLYYLSYDYLHFDEVLGNAQLRNVRVVPDTARARSMPTEKQPSVLLDVTIDSITIKGVRTLKALKGNDIAGDTIIINHPQVTMYVLKPLNKNTLIESEAEAVYKDILGSLKSIKVGFVLIDQIHVKAVHFRSGKKEFDFLNGNIELTDVLIDSAHNKDDSRTLFSKRAAFNVDSFRSYNNNRPELIVKKVAYAGAERSIVFDKIILNRFDDEKGEGKLLLDATSLRFAGLNSNAIVKEKDFVIDSIYCKDIKIYEPPKENAPDIKLANNAGSVGDTLSGFENAYSVKLDFLSFENVQYYPLKEKHMDWGPVRFQLRGVAADRFALFRSQPLKHIRELNLEIDYLKMASKDKQYSFELQKIRINSFHKNLLIERASVDPALGEAAFAAHYSFQKDRFDASMKSISLDGIEMENIFNNKLIASKLTIKNTSLKIFRDLNKPLEDKSKVGNYPSQMLEQLDFPIWIKEASLPNTYVEYREKQVNSGKTGTVSFNNSSLHITNITNDKAAISANNLLNIDFKTRVLKSIPMEGSFKFFLGKRSGEFIVKGKVGAFDAEELNPVSVPMALIRMKAGSIAGMNFDLKGDDYKASGDLVMQYEDLKVEVLKKQDSTGELKKRGLLSFLANIVVISNNPKNGQLREVHPEYDRNVNKSFFNLVWKTILTGMKETIGAE